MPNFELFDKRSNPARPQPMATLQKDGLLSFNGPTYQALGQPAAVGLYFDAPARLLALRAIAAEDPRGYKIRKQPASNSYLISVKFLLTTYGITTPVSRRYQMRDYGDGFMGFALDEPVANADRPGRRPPGEGGSPMREVP